MTWSKNTRTQDSRRMQIENSHYIGSYTDSTNSITKKINKKTLSKSAVLSENISFFLLLSTSNNTHEYCSKVLSNILWQVIFEAFMQQSIRFFGFLPFIVKFSGREDRTQVGERRGWVRERTTRWESTWVARYATAPMVGALPTRLMAPTAFCSFEKQHVVCFQQPASDVPQKDFYLSQPIQREFVRTSLGGGTYRNCLLLLDAPLLSCFHLAETFCTLLMRPGCLTFFPPLAVFTEYFRITTILWSNTKNVQLRVYLLPKLNEYFSKILSILVSC